MPKKKSGFPYEVHPTPAKGKDGRNIVYARPARGLRFSIKGIDDYCAMTILRRTSYLYVVSTLCAQAGGRFRVP